MISFDCKDPVDFIRECYEAEEDKGAFAGKMKSQYGLPNDFVYSTIKEQLGVEYIGPTSSDRKGLADLKPSFEDKGLMTKDDFLRELKRLRPDLDIKRINDHDLSLLGFKSTDGLMFPSKYENVDEYLKKLLTE